MSSPPTEEMKARLYAVHVARWRAHWGKRYDISQQPWPITDADWRQTPHGAPWDSNVLMAEWHLAFAQELLDKGLIP